MHKNRDSGKFTISLVDNGKHSLLRGIEAYDKARSSQDPMFLKDAIMFLHHGIELMMKQILVQHSMYLIFEDLNYASKRQKEADGKGVSIFLLDKPPRTVTYDESINRVEAFVKPRMLTSSLSESLKRLNVLRNQVEHYEITADRDSVVKVLAEIRGPLLDLLESEIPGTKRTLKPARVNRIWNGIQNTAKQAVQFEKEVYDLVCHFKGQQIPGKLLNTHDPFTLPIFERDKVSLEYRVPNSGVEVDIFAEDVTGAKWAIETKLIERERFRAIIRTVLFNVQSTNADVAWIVIAGDITRQARAFAKTEDVLLSGGKELQELKKLVGIGMLNHR